MRRSSASSPDAVCGRTWWCQLFSEPGAGSDLAGLTTKAVRDGETWVVNGQKVWTSGGDMADMGMLLARTEGWKVANTTLFHERSSPSGAGHGTTARAGTVAGDLARRAGDFTQRRSPRGRRVARDESPANSMIELARGQQVGTDPVVRQLLAKAQTLGELARWNTERGNVQRAAGSEIAGPPNLAKLLAGHILRLERDLGMQLLGPRGTLHAYTSAQRSSLEGLALGSAGSAVTAAALSAQALPIYGGTDQIQRNIIGERVPGLPKEPGDLARVPFNELPRNG